MLRSRIKAKLGVVAFVCNPSPAETQTNTSLELPPSSLDYLVSSQGIETLSTKKVNRT